MNFITITDNFLAGEGLERKLKQVFEYQKRNSVNLAAVTDLYENDIITDDAIKLLNFVYKMSIVREKDIMDYCEAVDIPNGEELLEKCFINVLLNRFALVDHDSFFYKKHVIPKGDDVQYFYCLNTGGNILLNQYVYDPEHETSWEPGAQSINAGKVRRLLIAARQYIAMLCFNVNYYEKYFKAAIKDYSTVSNSFWNYCESTPDGIVKKGFITDIYTRVKVDREWDEKLNVYNHLLKTDHWKYFWASTDKPSFIFICETDDDIPAFAEKVVSDMPHADTLYFTSVQRISDKMYNEQGSVLIYNKNENVLEPTKI